jgi:hypothetical protein
MGPWAHGDRRKLSRARRSPTSLRARTTSTRATTMPARRSQQRQPAEGEGAHQLTRGYSRVADPRGEGRGLQPYKSRARLNQTGCTAPGDDGQRPAQQRRKLRRDRRRRDDASRDGVRRGRGVQDIVEPRHVVGAHLEDRGGRAVLRARPTGIPRKGSTPSRRSSSRCPRCCAGPRLSPAPRPVLAARPSRRVPATTQQPRR